MLEWLHHVQPAHATPPPLHPLREPRAYSRHLRRQLHNWSAIIRARGYWSGPLTLSVIKFTTLLQNENLSVFSPCLFLSWHYYKLQLFILFVWYASVLGVFFCFFTYFFSVSSASVWVPWKQGVPLSCSPLYADSSTGPGAQAFNKDVLKV